ncbi:hypothetical protein E1B28_007928 [Marasmius oreades]|uniref:Uncharacterized protein n=1 Tax=Marasmius oreades TaxID=181124 RepID=A0A9P7S2K4_9AGAR|nr:uncharacterized protein E1B28_007928 [Marasmius oreades]KAG7094329.1 hypothetical protein E1B28_007928 [Marasmius oreades]
MQFKASILLIVVACGTLSVMAAGLPPSEDATPTNDLIFPPLCTFPVIGVVPCP